MPTRELGVYNEIMIPTGYAQCTVKYTGVNAPTGAANVFGLRLDDALATPASVAADVISHWNARIMTRLTDDVTCASVHVKFGPDSTGPFIDVANGQVGGQAVTSLAPNTAYLVGKTTGMGGRRGRGRMYLPGVAEAQVDDTGNLLGAWVTNLAATLAGFLADQQVVGLPLVVLHEPSYTWEIDSNGQPRRVPSTDPLPLPDEITALSISTRVATQRRRLRR